MLRIQITGATTLLMRHRVASATRGFRPSTVLWCPQTPSELRAPTLADVEESSSRLVPTASTVVEGLQHPITRCANTLALHPKHVLFISQQLRLGATVPFLARYRRDNTGGMDETVLQRVVSTLEELDAVEKRLANMLKSLKTRNILTDALNLALRRCVTVAELEDVYEPFKESRGSLADRGREKGLDGLARQLLHCEVNGKVIEARDPASDVEKLLAQRLGSLNREVEEGDRLLVALLVESISQCEAARSVADRLIRSFGSLTASVDESRRSKAGKSLTDEEWDSHVAHFSAYKDYSCKLTRVTATAFLAIQRGIAKGVLKSSISYPDGVAQRIATATLPSFRGFWRMKSASSTTCVVSSSLIKRALKEAVAVIVKSVLNAVRRDLKVIAEKESIAYFSHNLRRLLLQRPMPQALLAMDPGFRHGVKCVILDEHMELRGKFVVNLHDRPKFLEVLKAAVQKLKVNKIVIGNGTACRETEEVVSEAIQQYQLDCEYAIVMETGASVYSASAIAAEEFPDLNIMYRGAVSIGRRVQDPISELVKIPVKSIGVGLYQHDIPEKLLLGELQKTVQSCVSFVGVNVETASKYLLRSIPGIPSKVAEAIYFNRGRVKCRSQLLQVPGMNASIYQCVAGFLRVMGSSEPLDRTSIHPESYSATRKLCALYDTAPDTAEGRRETVRLVNKAIDSTVVSDELDEEGRAEAVKAAATAYYQATSTKCGCGAETLRHIVSVLGKDTLDPRSNLKHSGVFKRKIRTEGDLRSGEIVTGVVLNVTPFGAFVDIGIGHSTLVRTRSLDQLTMGLNTGDIVENLEVRAIGDESDRQFALRLDGMRVRNASELELLNESVNFRDTLMAIRGEQMGKFPDSVQNIQNAQ